jgi:hypothetical protein
MWVENIDAHQNDVVGCLSLSVIAIFNGHDWARTA